MLRIPPVVIRPLAVLVLLLTAATPALAAPKVVATIKPLHALLAMVTGTLAETNLLIDDAQSPHGYRLRPSQMRQLARADVVFYIDRRFETFLPDALAALDKPGAGQAMSQLPRVTLKALRAGGPWADDGDGDEDPDFDAHLWLDPENARAIVAAMADTLARLDPAQAAGYRRNAAAADRRIAALTDRLQRRLAPLGQVPFMVYHDAYQYFEARFGLNATGAVTAAPDRRPGARRIAALRRQIDATGLQCIFSEPQFRPGPAAALARDAGLRLESLDPVGVDLTPGADLYLTLLDRLATTLEGCLGTNR